MFIVLPKKCPVNLNAILTLQDSSFPSPPANSATPTHMRGADVPAQHRNCFERDLLFKKVFLTQNAQVGMRCTILISAEKTGLLNASSGVPFLSNTMQNPQCTLSSLITE